jgi:hypothetical protein
MNASWLARIVGAALLLVWALSGCAGPCSPEPFQCTALPPAPAASPESITEGRIYLDLSQSMRGYISDGDVPFTLFQRALDGLLQEAFAEVRLTNPTLLGFGSGLRKDLPPLESFVLTGKEGPPSQKFNETSTDLSVTFRDIRKSLRALSVVVTDGAQDQRDGPSGSVGEGFVRTALVNAVRDELIQKGFGVWLVGVMSGFDGCYYNVRPDRQGRVGQCIQVQRRPVYFWVFSRDLGKGRALVRSLADRLRAEAPNQVNALELSPGAIPGVHLAQPEPEEVRRLVTSKTALRDRLATIRLWRSPAAACVELPFVADGNVQLPLALRLDSPEDGLAPPGVTWKATIESPESLPGLRARTLPGILLLEISSSQTETIEIPLILQADLQRGLEASWIERWSTRDDASAQALEGKTLYLADIVSELLSPLAEPRRAACLHLTLIRG